MDILPLLILAGGTFAVLAMAVFAFSGPSTARASNRRLDALRGRHVDGAAVVAAGRARVLAATQTSTADRAAMRVLPRVEMLQKRLAMTGKPWTVGQFGQVAGGIFLVVAALLWFRGLPLPLALLIGIALGGAIPHFLVGRQIKKRVAKFNLKFPDGIDLLVRGLRSGLPITETIGVVGAEIEGPVGEEFRQIADRMKIGRTMDSALQETADRIGTPEFQFFVITLAIQRETGGNLAETLANLSVVLRGRIQMKLKVRAMSSEARASAYILGALPFVVFGLISMTSPMYMGTFYTDTRLIAVVLGGMLWMSMGVFIMAKMVNFEI